jgi:cyclophilin family peptidyl-prolyl cis-trans isomerase/HEAT repeat protein
LGRIPAWRAADTGDETAITVALCRALDDSESSVRDAALFALGQRPEPYARPFVEEALRSGDAGLRTRAVEAASKLGPELQDAVLAALADPELAVRCEAVVGAARWSTEGVAAAALAAIDGALLAALAPERGESGRHPDFVWRALYALGRRRSALGVGPALEYRAHPDPLVRIFAAKALAVAPLGDPAGTEAASALAELLGDVDWRVAFEAALALGDAPPESAHAALVALADHGQVHARAQALRALGGIAAQRDGSLPVLRRGWHDVSVEVKSGALDGLARLLPPAEARRALEEAARANDPTLRAAAARAAARLAQGDAWELLQLLARDESPFVAGAAIETLGGFAGASSGFRDFLRGLLADSADEGVRLGALASLADHAELADVEALAAALRAPTGPLTSELAFGAARHLAAILERPEARGTPAGERALALLSSLRESADPYVAHVAAEELAQLGGELQLLGSRAQSASVPPELPRPGTDAPLFQRNPVVAVDTSRGELIFELLPLEAPVHVHSFLELAARGIYDGLTFHRVVPDFVIQGGDPRGDGNGGVSWRGDSLRAELGPRKYARGSLGMPRNEDPESGGGQLFVTHRPTPHLDGRYTIFGELRAGGEALDRVEVGDRILGVRIVDAGVGP